MFIPDLFDSDFRLVATLAPLAQHAVRANSDIRHQIKQPSVTYNRDQAISKMSNNKILSKLVIITK